MTSFDDQENLDALGERTTRDPFQLELLNAVKKRQQKETGYITNDINGVSRHDPALDIKMAKFLANKQSPYHSEGHPGESSSKRTSSDLWSPGTSHVNKPLHNIERQIPSIEISTDEDIGIGSDDSDDSDDKYTRKGKQQSKGQKSASSRRTSIKEEVHVDAKPSVPRPGLVKRPAFHSDLPDDQQKPDGTSLKKIEKKQEKLKSDDGKKMINGKGVTTPNKYSKKEDTHKKFEDAESLQRNMFGVDKDSKMKHISREHRSQFDNSLEKRKFGRTAKLEISDEDSSNDSDVMDVHSEYRQQIKDASSKRIPGSHLTHHSSNEILDDDDHNKRDRQKKETKLDKNADKLRAQQISSNRSEEKNDDFSIARSHRDRVSSPDELERKTHIDKKGSKQLYIDDDDKKMDRQKKDTKSDKNADKHRAQHISRNRSEEKNDDFSIARSHRDRVSSPDELERKSHIDKKSSKQFYIDDDDDDDYKRDRQKKETKSDKNADKHRAQHTSRNKSQEKQDDFSITRSHRDRVSSPDELERKSHIDKKGLKQLYIDDDDKKKMDRQKQDTKLDKNADKLRAQQISRNRSEEKKYDFSIARSHRDRVSSPDELERKTHIDKKGSKQFYIDDNDHDDYKRDRQKKEAKSDINADKHRAQHTSRNKSQEKQDNSSVTRSPRDRVSSPDELERKSPIDRKSSKNPYIDDYDDKRDRRTKETKSDKNADKHRDQHISKNRSQEKQDDRATTRSPRDRVSSPDELERKSPIDRKSSKKPYIDDYDDKRDRQAKETKSDKNADKHRAQHISKNRSPEKQDDRATTRSPRDRVSSPDDAERKSCIDKKGSKQPHIDAVDDLFSSDSRRRQSVASNNNESRSRSGSTKDDKGHKRLGERDKSKERSSRSQDRLDYDKEAQKVPKQETPTRPRSGVVKGHDKDIKDKRSSSQGRFEHDSNLQASITKKYGPSISVESDLLSSDDSDFEISTSFNRSTRQDRETAAKLEPPASNQLRHKRAGSLGSALSNENRRDPPTDNRKSPRESDGGRRRSKSDLQSNPYDEGKLSERTDREQNEFSIRKSGSLGSLLHRKESTTKQDISSPRTKPIGGRREKEHVSESVKNGKPRIKENLAPNRLKNSKSRAKNDYRANPDNTSDSEDDFERENLRIKKQASKGGTTGLASTSKLRHAGKTEGVSSKTGPLKANMNIGDATLKKTLTKNQETKGNHGQKNKRSLSFTNISNISPQSRYYEDRQEEDSRPRATDSASLREQFYYEWLKKKDSGTKTQVLKQRQEKKEKAEEAEREQEDKKIMSKKAFEAWTSNKVEKSKETESTLKEKKLSEREKQDELRQKKLDSKKYFESWKAKKDEDLIEIHRKKKKEEREQRQKELEDKDEKMNSSKKVYENWKSKKDDVLKEKFKQQKLQEKEQRMIEYEKQEKKKKAEKVFENWKEKKPRSPRDSGPTLTQRAWCPSSRNCGDVVPQQIQPVIQRNPPNRTRTLSASRTMSASARYDSLRKTSHRL